MTIGERIRKKRDEHDMTLEDIAKLIGVSRQTMSRYETGAIKGVPSDKIELIAKVLGSTPGYLMGWENASEEIKQAMDIKDLIKSRRSEIGKTLEDIAKEVGVSKTTVMRWENGDIDDMRRSKVVALANALRVSPAYLMGWENMPTQGRHTAEQAAFRAEMGDFTADEMFVTRTYRHATKYEQSLLYGVAVLVTKAASGQHQEEADRDGQLAAESLVRQYSQAQSLPEVGEK